MTEHGIVSRTGGNTQATTTICATVPLMCGENWMTLQVVSVETARETSAAVSVMSMEPLTPALK